MQARGCGGVAAQECVREASFSQVAELVAPSIFVNLLEPVSV